MAPGPVYVSEAEDCRVADAEECRVAGGAGQGEETEQPGLAGCQRGSVLTPLQPAVLGVHQGIAVPVSVDLQLVLAGLQVVLAGLLAALAGLQIALVDLQVALSGLWYYKVQ